MLCRHALIARCSLVASVPIRARCLSTVITPQQTHFAWSKLIKPFVFSTIFTGASFATAMYLDKNRKDAVHPDAGLKTMTAVIATNVLVFAGLYSSRASVGLYLPKLSRYTLLDASTVNRRPLTLLTCGFSHVEIWHLGLNMLALYSFGSGLIQILGPNQFLAFYTSSICWSSMAQVTLEFYRVRRGRIPRPSLGASGGVYALLGLSACLVPQAAVSLIFLPFFSIPIGYAFAGIMTMDLIGILRGWSTFGHAAHFGGGLFGFSYATSGAVQHWRQTLRDQQKSIMARWGR